ncbi:MAG: carbohydrate ABC transporter permease, partial [Gaiellaceae bacterium]
MTHRVRSALWRKRSRRFRSGLLALLVGVVFAFPFYWVVDTSLNSSNRVYQFPPNFLPGGVFDNYAHAWHEATWVRYFLNTVLIAGSTVALVLLTSLLAGFALGVMRFRGREICFFLILSILMIPKVVLLIPDYIV